ncbi:hypothetical protein PR048_030085 [Dryococelus australis]|uniref:Uncharacterized protein n=1 Tax=Dryococelus australis TaxID=614101 RepID=A0ABQ9G8R2_9NEOP|nr:hypothetical protein PR048_030085 [Dryococelus australis]
MVKSRFEIYNFVVHQAAEDADTLIVRRAINMVSSFNTVFVVGEDIYLLVLLVTLEKGHSNVYFKKPGKGKAIEQVYSPLDLQAKPTVADNILFLHAFSGCDTSAIFGQEKKKFLKILENSEQLNKIVQVFKEEGADSDTIAAAGKKFLNYTIWKP